MAYVLPMLQHIKAQDDLKPGEGPVGLVLLPCRELWPQVEREVNVFEDYSRLQCAAACGGDGHGAQSFDGRDFVHIVVATPGRLLDLLDQKKTNLRRVTYMVVDEADQKKGQAQPSALNQPHRFAHSGSASEVSVW